MGAIITSYQRIEYNVERPKFLIEFDKIKHALLDISHPHYFHNDSSYHPAPETMDATERIKTHLLPVTESPIVTLALYGIRPFNIKEGTEFIAQIRHFQPVEELSKRLEGILASKNMIQTFSTPESELEIVSLNLPASKRPSSQK